jgi:hypothetical protein
VCVGDYVVGERGEEGSLKACAKSGGANQPWLTRSSKSQRKSVKSLKYGADLEVLADILNAVLA